MAVRSPSSLEQICLRRLRAMTTAMYERSVGLCAGSWNIRNPYRYPVLKGDFLRAQLLYASRLWDETMFEQQFHFLLTLPVLCTLAERHMRKVMNTLLRHRRVFSKHTECGRIVLVSQPRPPPSKYVAQQFFDNMRAQVHGPNCRCFQSRLKQRYSVVEEHPITLP